MTSTKTCQANTRSHFLMGHPGLGARPKIGFSRRRLVFFGVQGIHRVRSNSANQFLLSHTLKRNLDGSFEQTHVPILHLFALKNIFILFSPYTIVFLLFFSHANAISTSSSLPRREKWKLHLFSPPTKAKRRPLDFPRRKIKPWKKKWSEICCAETKGTEE